VLFRKASAVWCWLVGYSVLSVGTVLHDQHCKHCRLSSLVKWTDIVVEQAGTLGQAINRREGS